MGAEESKSAPPGEVSERINSVELSELRVAFSTLAPDGVLTAEALTSALPPVLPWEELHRVLLEAVAARGHPGGGLGFDAFVLGLALTVRSRQSARQRMGLLRSLYAGGDRDGPLGADRLTALLSGAMRASGGGEGDDTALGAAVADAAELPAAEWDRWAADQLPALGTAFETSVIEALCAVGRAGPPSGCLSPMTRPPLLSYQSDAQQEGSLLTPGLAWLCALTLGPADAGEPRSWRCLYSSAAQGQALSRFSTFVGGYTGPTLLVARCAPLSDKGEEEGVVFGAFVDSAWKPTDKYFGGAGCALLQLAPAFHVHRPTGISRNFAFFNLPADRAATFRARGGAQLPEGVAFGGQIGTFRLRLDDDLSRLSWLHSDTTYAPHESRRLAEGARRVAAVEVWGCGREQDQAAQLALQRRREADAAKAGSLTLETRKKMAGGDAATRFVLSAAGAHDFKGEELKASEERLARERGHE
mmetsp:Transcript_5106/g.16807  ORF Transcript_5106/g.16807 Transcript_5106/m.16807 type:complete len:474 (+) Transcript_5106:73-1494(+)